MCITEDVKNSYKFPFGTEGREMLAGMNEHHAPVTTWTLELMEPQSEDTILDIGCGGGRALKRVSSLVEKGKVAQEGNSAELMNSNGIYHHMVTL